MGKSSVSYLEALVELRIQFELNGWEEEEDMRSSDCLSFCARLFGKTEGEVMADVLKNPDA